MPPIDGEVLRRDVHPAEVLCPDGSVLRKCRVFVTSRRLIAYQTVGEPLVDVEIEPDSVPLDRQTLHGSLECCTDHGTYWVNRGQGCGCGSPLKAMGPPAPWTRRELAV